MKDKDYSNVRKWAAENCSNDANSIFRKLYDTANVHMDAASIAQLVMILGKYQYQAAFVADQEINLASCLTEIMIDCDIK